MQEESPIIPSAWRNGNGTRTHLQAHDLEETIGRQLCMHATMGTEHRMRLPDCGETLPKLSFYIIPFNFIDKVNSAGARRSQLPGVRLLPGVRKSSARWLQMRGARLRAISASDTNPNRIHSTRHGMQKA